MVLTKSDQIKIHFVKDLPDVLITVQSIDIIMIMNDKRATIENRIAQVFPCVFEISGKKCFKASDSTYFVISDLTWSGNEIIVAEYADSENEALNGLFGEDGDLYYTDELSEDKIAESIIEEANL